MKGLSTNAKVHDGTFTTKLGQILDGRRILIPHENKADVISPISEDIVLKRWQMLIHHEDTVDVITPIGHRG